MPKEASRDFELFIVDAFIAIHKIKLYTASFKDAHELQASSLHWDATMRAFEIIGESLNNLLQNEIFASSSPSYFRKIVNFRNVIAHGYFGISAEEVWDIIVHKIDELDKDLFLVIKSEFDIKEAISLTIDEYLALNEQKIVLYLNKLLSKI
jgi:uncharacterized protein with HEPN domain